MKKEEYERLKTVEHRIAQLKIIKEMLINTASQTSILRVDVTLCRNNTNIPILVTPQSNNDTHDIDIFYINTCIDEKIKELEKEFQ